MTTTQLQPTGLPLRLPVPDRVPPRQIPIGGFPAPTYGPPTPRVDEAELELRVIGLARAKRFRWDDLLTLLRTILIRDFHMRGDLFAEERCGLG